MMDLSKYSKSEVGHVINVGNLNKLNNLLETFGAEYNPSVNAITLVELHNKYAASDIHIGIVHQKTNVDNANINDRKNAFEDADLLATRIFNAFAAAAEDDKDIEDLKRYLDKFRGTPPTPETRENEVGQEIKEPRSNSQQSFINLADHFRGMVEYVDGHVDYNPNEDDLKIPAIKAVLEDLVKMNNNASISEEERQKAEFERNVELYDPKTGLYKLTKRVKNYIKSVYGGDSPQFDQVRAIKFTDRRKKKRKK